MGEERSSGLLSEHLLWRTQTLAYCLKINAYLLSWWQLVAPEYIEQLGYAGRGSRLLVINIFAYQFFADFLSPALDSILANSATYNLSKIGNQVIIGDARNISNTCFIYTW